MTAITLLTQADCTLCEHAKQVLARVGADHPLEITQAGVLFAPGVLVDGRPFGHGRLSERKLRRTLGRMPAHTT